jgi:hypothetical protein
LAGYDVVFDVAHSGYTTWWFPAYGAVTCLLILVGVEVARRLGLARGVWFTWLCAVFGVAWTTITFVGTYSDYWRLSADARAGAAVVVEGQIESIEQQPLPADEQERLVVAGHVFTLNDAEVGSAFNLTRRTGSPLRAGQWVRIWHVDSQIVKIAIKRGTAGKTPPHGP